MDERIVEAVARAIAPTSFALVEYVRQGGEIANPDHDLAACEVARDQARAAIAAHTAALAEAEWQPIDGYPRDKDGWGPNVLLFVPTGLHASASDYRLLTGRLEADMWLAWDDEGAMYDLKGKPTHWRPLPAAPDQR